MLEVGMLGPLNVSVNGRPVTLTSPTLRTLLAALALAADSPVSVDRLAVALWNDESPDHLRRAVQTCISRLRQVLGAELITTETAGYRLRVDPDRVDALRFIRLLDRAGQTPDTDTERERLEEALGLWRGSPLDGLRSDRLARMRGRLIERYLSAVERRVDLDLAAGRQHAVIAELQDLTASYPLRESLWARLLTALARSGRPAEALSLYEAVRRRLVDELGADPGHELKQIYADLLAAKPAPLPTPPPAAATASAPVAPRQLPADIAGFTGRAAALKVLHGLVEDRDQRPVAVVISAIGGMAGIGKTTLAVHWAHQVADRFPDGQLYVNLRGFDASGQAVAPAEVVRRFLDALGLPPERIPADFQAQLGLYRSLLADRRVLVVLDNARDAQQVRPLLPGSPTCLVLVTSRSRLVGLVAAEAARPLALDVLADDEARELLATRIGAHRVAAEPAAIEAIVARCAGLPLALAIAAARAATSSLPLATLASQLDDGRPALDPGDPAADARVVFSWSYHMLSPDAARLFRLLGLHPGPDICAAAMASLAGIPPAQVRPLLAELFRIHLVTEHGPDRFGLHDLLRAYATELAHTRDSEHERHSALHRLLDHYLHTAHAASLVVNPQRVPIEIAPAQSGVTPESIADSQHALAWYAAEHSVLLPAIQLAATVGFDSHAWQLAWAATDFLYWRGYWNDLLTIHRAALQAAQRCSDLAAQALAHRAIAMAYGQMARPADAEPHLQTALDLHQQLDDPLGQAQTHLNLAAHLAREHLNAEALRHCQLAHELFVTIDNLPGQARALNAIGWYQAQLGDYRAALRHCQLALPLQQQLGDRSNEASTLDSLGYAHYRLGNYQEAIDYYQRAIDLYEQLGIRYYQATALNGLADIYQTTGELESARAVRRRAFSILEELDHPDAQMIRAKLQGGAQVQSADRQNADPR